MLQILSLTMFEKTLAKHAACQPSALRKMRIDFSNQLNLFN
jgi:hypothetical protein